MADSTAENEQPLSVRVLLPDGGELVPPEERDAEEEEPTDEAERDEGADESVAEEEPEAEAEEPQVEEESERAEAEADEGTRILHLNLDRVFLDLLGLEVDLDEVTLDITARTGKGNLLGNLLSAVSGLLDGSGLDDLGGGDGSLLGLPSLGLPSMPELPNPMERARELASALADRIREAIGEVVDALPLEEFLTQFFQAVVDQLLNGANGDEDGDSDAEPA